MAILSQKKIQVLDVGELVESGKESRNKYFYKVLQVWTGKTAGNMRVYAEKGREGFHDDLDNLTAGDYMVDIVERNGDFGAIELVYQNPQPSKQPKSQEQKA
jgi:hypothetical protein